MSKHETGGNSGGAAVADPGPEDTGEDAESAKFQYWK
jgi:hypothetical protein